VGATDARMFTPAGDPLTLALPLVLSVDHRPERPDECSRIIGAGARVVASTFADGAKGNIARIFSPTVRAATIYDNVRSFFTTGTRHHRTNPSTPLVRRRKAPAWRCHAALATRLPRGWA